MTEKIIDIALEFSPYPSGRKVRDGRYSGERFRTDFLVPALEKFDKVIVLLDGVSGYPSSFTDEAFGGLVRNRLFGKDTVLEKLEISYDDPVYKTYADEIELAIQEAHQLLITEGQSGHATG